MLSPLPSAASFTSKVILGVVIVALLGGLMALEVYQIVRTQCIRIRLILVDDVVCGDGC